MTEGIEMSLQIGSFGLRQHNSH